MGSGRLRKDEVIYSEARGASLCNIGYFRGYGVRVGGVYSMGLHFCRVRRPYKLPWHQDVAA